MSGKVTSLPTGGLAQLQSKVESETKATKERGRQWLAHREEYSKVKDRLETIDGKLQYDVMVPLTSKAFMPGKLVHTNEILVLLGDNWFLETSAKEAAKIAGRRVDQCDKMLMGLEEEMRLNQGWRDQTKRIEGEAEGAVDIREEYQEEEEKQWREKHKENVKREKKGSAGVKEEEEVSEGELWSRLEELEVREALEKEWEQDDESESSEEEEEVDDEEEQEEQEIGSKQLKRRVSWGNLEKPVLDEGLRITFSHSDQPCPTPIHAPLSQEGAWPPQTPGDVCLSEIKPSKSILKPSSSSSLSSLDSWVPPGQSRSQVRAFPPGFQPQRDHFSQFDKVVPPQVEMDCDEAGERIVDYVPAISDVVVEKNVGQGGGGDSDNKEPKRVSRFKASRTNK